jgi:hypothetical protein
MERSYSRKLLYIFIFSVAFAFVEAAVVIYLRTIYYPEGFHFPLTRIIDYNLKIEFFRELATIIMMFSLGALLARKFWEGFGYFLIIFGIWDIFFYLWLKAAINWPSSIFEPDILFLIPIPWIGPVLAPVLISITMIIIGLDITVLFHKGFNFRPALLHWFLVLSGTSILLYSFMSDLDAAFYQQYPEPYNWFLFTTGIALYAAAQIHLRKKTQKDNS